MNEGRKSIEFQNSNVCERVFVPTFPEVRKGSCRIRIYQSRRHYGFRHKGDTMKKRDYVMRFGFLFLTF